MFWLMLELQNVANWTHKSTLVIKGKYIMDGSACGLCLNNIAYCMLPMQEMLGPGDFKTQESRHVCCQYRSCLGILITRECFVCMISE